MKNIQKLQNYFSWLVQDKRLAVAFMVIVLFSCLLVLELGRLWWGTSNIHRVSQVNSNKATAKQTANLRYLHTTKNWQIFGPESMPPVAKTRDANMMLVAIFHSSDKKSSRAVIVNDNGEEFIYSVGEKLLGEYPLREIRRDRIVYRRGGKLHTLLLDLDKT